MINENIQKFIRRLKRPIFTTRELAQIAGKSISTTTQSLNYLEKQGIVRKVYRGIWIDENNSKISPYAVIPFILPKHRAYVSFISALHLYHMIEQIPQIITLASTGRTKIIRTKFGIFEIHQIAPSFFRGFGWYKDIGDFLIADPEKALVDCLYLSAHKKKQFGNFPELHISDNFNIEKSKKWIEAIPSVKIRLNVQKKLDVILKSYGKR